MGYRKHRRAIRLAFSSRADSWRAWYAAVKRQRAASEIDDIISPEENVADALAAQVKHWRAGFDPDCTCSRQWNWEANRYE